PRPACRRSGATCSRGAGCRRGGPERGGRSARAGGGPAQTSLGTESVPVKTAGEHLTPLDRYILSRLTAEPCTMERLSRLCDHHNDRYFQKRVKRLVEAGRVAHGFHGYRLADAPVVAG